MPPVKRKTPTQRAAEYADKLRELEARRKERSSPGPGYYDPKKPPATISHGSTSAFKSGTNRMKTAHSTPSPMDVSDPGAYDMSSHKSLVRSVVSILRPLGW